MIRDWVRRLGHLPERRAAEAVLVLLGVAVVFDAGYGGRFTPIGLYVGTVAVAAWFLRPGRAVAVALASCALTVAFEGILRGGAARGATLAWYGASTALALVVPALALSRLRVRVEQEERFAALDALTGLPNRGSFIAKLDEELARSARYGHAFTLSYLDLDNFKAVNDLEGHDAGDQLLRAVADALRASTRQTDILGRLGGDEFAALLPETTFGPAGQVLEKVRRNLNQAMKAGGWPVTFSIGAITFEAPVDTSREALRVADKAMYEVKRHGKDAIRHLTWDGASALP